MTTDAWNAQHYRERHAFVFRSSQDLIADWLAPQPGERVLDLGCGSGELSAQLAAAGAQVTGLDASAAMIEGARQHHPGLNFVVQDAHTLSYAGNFEAVFSNAALHWMAPLPPVLAGLQRALVPGGRLALEMGGAGNVQVIRQAVSGALSELGLPALPHPWTFPTPGELCTLLEAAGFRVTRLHLFDRPSPLLGHDGFGAWLAGFGGAWLAPLGPQERAAVLQRAEALARPQLWDGRQWVADYVRLRVLATR